MAKFKVNSPTLGNKLLEARTHSSLLRALLDAGFEVPHLCYHEALSDYGACRLCLVEVQKGSSKPRKLTTACNYPVKDGIEVFLDTDKVRDNRKTVVALLASRCPTNPTLRSLAEDHDVDVTALPYDTEADSCILCGLCERVCREAVGVDAITFSGRGDRKMLEPPYGPPAEACIGCSSCARICPTGHIRCEDTPRARQIWERVFPMVSCSRCGKALITEAQRDHLVQSEGIPISYFDLCDLCKRPDVAQRFAAVGR